MLDLSVIILTYNEEIHIRRCLENVCPVAKDVFVIDSCSTDRTVEIASEFDNVIVLSHPWPNNHGVQFNWGLDNALSARNGFSASMPTNISDRN